MVNLRESLTAVQKFLQENPLAKFAEHGIKVKTDGNHLIVDYNMIEVKWTETYGYVCRGLVLDARDFSVLGMGLHKFFNSGEGYAADIDWETAKVFEKMDGTMVCRWWSPYTSQFEYSTRRQLPIDLKRNEIFGSGITWDKLIDRCMGDLPEGLNQQKDETLVFEVMSPVNRVVVQHKDYHVRLIARRNNKTLREVDLAGHRLAPKTFLLSSAEDCKDFANTLVGVESEGFVVCDANHNRIKIKGSSYLALHHLKDSSTNSIKSLILVVRNGEWSEVGTYFPEFIPAMKSISELIKTWTAKHAMTYESVKRKESQKEFALSIKGKVECPALLFQTRSGKASSIQDAINQMGDSQFVKAIKPLVEVAGIKSVCFEEKQND